MSNPRQSCQILPKPPDIDPKSTNINPCKLGPSFKDKLITGELGTLINVHTPYFAGYPSLAQGSSLPSSNTSSIGGHQIHLSLEE